jgi:hypothetical protein
MKKTILMAFAILFSATAVFASHSTTALLDTTKTDENVKLSAPLYAGLIKTY